MYGSSMTPSGMMFGNTMPPQYTPQFQSMPNQQPMFTQPVRNVIPGKMVSSFEEITVADVPQDGSLALFPKSDGSCVFGKVWNGNGSITDIRYVPESAVPAKNEKKEEDKPVETSAASASTVTLDDIVSRLDDVMDFLTDSNNSNSKPQNRGKNNQNVKKENYNA